MIGYLVLGVSLALGLGLIIAGIRGASASQAMRWLWQAIAAVSALVGLFFMVTGRPTYALVPAFGILVGVLGWLLEVSLAPRKPKGSSIDTPFLRLSLDHETGQVTGDIIAGPYEGRRIESLRVDELVDLLGHYRRVDAASARLVEAYLDRTSPMWRERYDADGRPKEAYAHAGAQAEPSRPGGPMSKGEALHILGLRPGATSDDIRLAHRRKLQEHHPDRGGDQDTAARINQARDVLLAD
ncbi:MAG: hypothetical protein KIT16_12835 [Rhodospirillaceae bacterium]|nr:hypothetical protein [Rhodospirillaceae bacterium]